MLSAPMNNPVPEHGPTSLVNVVSCVIVSPHWGEAAGAEDAPTTSHAPTANATGAILSKTRDGEPRIALTTTVPQGDGRLTGSR